MNILIAPDSFKGSLTAEAFCEIAEKAIVKVIEDANVIKVPLADGGEGTVEALVLNSSGKIIHQEVTGPMGNPVEAHFGILGDGKTAVIEMASASGLPLVPDEAKDPMRACTYGTGELIKSALDRDCDKIIMGIGGSATNEGGAGAMKALGFKLLDENSNNIGPGAEGLLKLERIDPSSKDQRLENVKFTVACDVTNPLLGPNGAAQTYGPQKGATESQIPILESALNRLNEIMNRDLNRNVSEVPGAGAAGGFGAGLLAFLDAELKGGFDIIKETINLEQKFQETKIDLLITGEGQINDQTVNGKLPVGVAGMAKKFDVPVIAIVGAVGNGANLVFKHGIDSVFSICDKPMPLSEALENADTLLFDCVSRVMRLLKTAK